MKAMVLEALADVRTTPTPLRLLTIEKPTPCAGEILLRVIRCGVCHTELDDIEGHTPPPQLPVVLGHQVVGRVMESDSLLSENKRVMEKSAGQRYCEYEPPA